MAIDINVSAICPDKQVIIQRAIINNRGSLVLKDDITQSVDLPKNELAGCIRDNPNKFRIVLNLTEIRNLWAKSWLHDYVTVDVFEAAFTLHELAHIKYTDFNNDNYSNEIERQIRNLLEDSRVEYSMSYDFPESSVFFNILLSTIQLSIASEGEEKKEDTEDIMFDVFDLVRYNIIKDNSNKKLMTKMLPLVVLMRRGSFNDCIVASEIIINMIENELTSNEIIEFRNEDIKQKPITSEDREKKQEKHSQNEIEKQIADKFFDEQIVKEKIEASFNETKAGNAISVINKERTSFFLNTAIENKEEINALRDIFNRAFVDFKNISSKDGDLNFMKQQSAYLNSITGEEGKDYHYRTKERILLDVVLLRDISGSIREFRTDYAKSVVILLSALENIQGIRTAQIDFNSKHHVNKTFESGVEKATINPVADGGTSITGAYQEVLKYHFKGKRNLVIVISDGDFYEDLNTVKILEEKIKKVAKILKFAIGGYNKEGFKRIKVKDIPKEMSDVIIKEGLI